MSVNKHLLQNYISRMPSLSTTVTKVLEICNKPTTSPNDLNRVISLDPVLTGRVLKVVNSAYYAMDNEVTSLTRAIILLGLNTVKNLALSTAVLESMGGKKGVPHGLDMDDFWLHSLAVGVIARCLAIHKKVPIVDREEFFVAGLLHDLGKIPLNQCYADEYIHVVKSAGASSIHDAELNCLGIDHCAVGGMIAEKWRLHGNIAKVLLHHHDSNGFSNEESRLLMIVTLANLCANEWQIGSAGDVLIGGNQVDYYLDQVQLPRLTLDEIHGVVFDEIDKAKIFLQLSNKN